MKTIHNNIPFTFKGKQVNCTVEIYTRGGTKSPDLWIVVHKGKRRSPYWQRKHGLSCTLNGLFKIVYAPAMESLFYYGKTNPLLSLIPKPTDHYGSFSIPVILGLEHGVAFSVIDES